MKKSKRAKRESFFEKQEEIIIDVVAEEKEVVKSKMKLFSQRRFQVGAFVIIAIIVGALVAGYVFIGKDDSPVDQGGKLSPSQISELVTEVGSKIVIPKGETPTIATVTDITKLESKPFFRNAKNGDKFMIFGSTNMAILYRSSIHKIITVAPFNAQNNPVANTAVPSTTPSLTPSVTPTISKIKVAILNSTKEAGLAKKGAALFGSDKYEVVSTANAKGEYSTTSVSQINKTTLKDADLKSISGLLTKVKATVKGLSADEAVPTGADVVIILGSDFSDAY